MDILRMIETVCHETHYPMAFKEFGDEGTDTLFKVMEVVKLLYRHVEPERISGQVLIFKVVGADSETVARSIDGAVVDFASLANNVVGDLCFEIGADEQVRTRSFEDIVASNVQGTSIVYMRSGLREEFLAGQQRKVVLRLDPSARSQFCIPTFSTLREALRHYARENVSESTCFKLQEMWNEPSRLFLRAGPEGLMRDSLVQFLRNRIGADHDVWPEQNVNDRNPVDVRVQPRFYNNRLMIIEIKWLGDSVAADGHVTARHRDARALEGARQLAEYLDQQRQSAPGRVIQAYYVIVDARRRNLPNGSGQGESVNRVDGLYYENIEIVLDPPYHRVRGRLR